MTETALNIEILVIEIYLFTKLLILKGVHEITSLSCILVLVICDF